MRFRALTIDSQVYVESRARVQCVPCLPNLDYGKQNENAREHKYQPSDFSLGVWWADNQPCANYSRRSYEAYSEKEQQRGKPIEKCSRSAWKKLRKCY